MTMTKPQKFFALMVIVSSLALVLSCTRGPTTPDPVPSPSVGATHGSSAVDGAAACTVQRASISTFVRGNNTEGYFSVTDKGVGVRLRYVFVDGTNKEGECPGPSRADWTFGNRNDAGCTYTGVRTEPNIRIDCSDTGKTSLVTPAYYPDGTSELIVLDIDVS